MYSGLDLPIGYVGLSLGPQDARGPPANCGTRYMISSIDIRQNIMSSLLMKLSFLHLIRFCVDNSRAFQHVSMNLNTTVGQAACWQLC